MFSQFRQAVENLAQPLPRQSQDDTLSADVRSQSPASAQLAENALVNLRRSIATQRTASPAQQNTANPRPRSASPGPSSSTTKSTTDSGLRKTTLEERLRASFVASESSGGSTPNPSTSASPTLHPVPVGQHPLSPAPVPDSPSLAVGTTPPALDTPVGDSVQAEECKDTLAPSQEPDEAAEPPSVTPPTGPQDTASSTVGSTDSIHRDSTANPCVGETLTPQATNTEMQQYTSEVVDALTARADPPGEESVRVETEPTITDGPTDDVEALQERLKLMEQRFAGKVAHLARLG